MIYNLRAFALEGGEELKGEAIKIVETAVGRRIETTLATFDEPLEWDLDLVRQDQLMHYLLTVPCFEPEGTRPRSIADAKVEGGEAGTKAFRAKLEQLADHGPQVLALVMLNVLDEKWKDHLYDLDQLRNSIGYRAWGQKVTLLESNQEAYTMFVDLMTDIQHTFTEPFLRVQLMYEQPAPVAPASDRRRPTRPPIPPQHPHPGKKQRKSDGSDHFPEIQPGKTR